MLRVKREGEPYPIQDWTPPHPARWCLLKFLWTALITGNMHGPYGMAWRHQNRFWVCYMRFCAPWTNRVRWRHIRLEHYHRLLDEDLGF